MLFNMTKSELYRASRMKCTYILPIIMVAIVMLYSFMYMKIDTKQMGIGESMFESYIEDEDEKQEALKDDIGNLISVDEEEEDDEKTSIFGEGAIYDWDVDGVFNIFASAADVILLLSIFVGIFIGVLYSTGADKNNLMAAGHKNVLLAARAITIAVYTLLFHALILGSTVLGCALFGHGVSFGDPGRVAVYFFLSWFMVFSFSMVIMMIANLIKSQAGAITIGIILAYGILNLILIFVDFLIHKLIGFKDFSISEYTITGRLTSLRFFDSAGSMIKSAVVCTVIMTIAFVIQVCLNRKRDLC